MCGLTREQRQALEELDAQWADFPKGQEEGCYAELLAVLRGEPEGVTRKAGGRSDTEPV